MEALGELLSKTFHGTTTSVSEAEYILSTMMQSHENVELLVRFIVSDEIPDLTLKVAAIMLFKSVVVNNGVTEFLFERFLDILTNCSSSMSEYVSDVSDAVIKRAPKTELIEIEAPVPSLILANSILRYSTSFPCEYIERVKSWLEMFQSDRLVVLFSFRVLRRMMKRRIQGDYSVFVPLVRFDMDDDVSHQCIKFSSRYMKLFSDRLVSYRLLGVVQSIFCSNHQTFLYCDAFELLTSLHGFTEFPMSELIERVLYPIFVLKEDEYELMLYDQQSFVSSMDKICTDCSDLRTAALNFIRSLDERSIQMIAEFVDSHADATDDKYFGLMTMLMSVSSSLGFGFLFRHLRFTSDSFIEKVASFIVLSTIRDTKVPNEYILLAYDNLLNENALIQFYSAVAFSNFIAAVDEEESSLLKSELQDSLKNVVSVYTKLGAEYLTESLSESFMHLISFFGEAIVDVSYEMLCELIKMIIGSQKDFASVAVLLSSLDELSQYMVITPDVFDAFKQCIQYIDNDYVRENICTILSNLIKDADFHQEYWSLASVSQECIPVLIYKDPELRTNSELISSLITCIRENSLFNAAAHMILKVPESIDCFRDMIQDDEEALIINSILMVSPELLDNDQIMYWIDNCPPKHMIVCLVESSGSYKFDALNALLERIAFIDDDELFFYFDNSHAERFIQLVEGIPSLSHRDVISNLENIFFCK